MPNPTTPVVVIHRLSLVLLSAVLVALAIPNHILPYGSLLLGAVALIPYLTVIYRETSKRARMRYGAFFGVVTTFLAHYWLLFFEGFSAWTIGTIALGYGGCHALLANSIYRLRGLSHNVRLWAVAVAWSAFEYFKSIGYLAFPWGLIALPATTSLPLIQHIDITGIWSLSLLMALLNTVGVEWIARRSSRATLWRQTACILALFLVLIGHGYLRLSRPPIVTDTVTLALIQQNTDSWAPNGAENSLDANIELTKQALQELRDTENREPAMVIWSETSMRYPYEQNTSFYANYPEDQSLLTLLQRGTWHLLSGAPYLEEGTDGQNSYYNAAIQLNPRGELLDHYHKRQLIPFAEHIPFWEIPALQSFYSRVIGLYGSWRPGQRNTIFHIPTESRAIPYAVLICFEDSFGYLGSAARRAGAEILINLTNNSWSRTEAAQIQHFASARLRSVENRVALVRSTNSGVTAVVDATGRTIQQLPMFEKGYLLVDVPLYQDQPLTPYSRYGDWLGKLIVIAALTLYALSWRISATDTARRSISVV